MQVVLNSFISKVSTKLTSSHKPFFRGDFNNVSPQDIVCFKHSPQDRAVTKAENNLRALELKLDFQALEPFIRNINDKMHLFKRPSLEIKECLKSRVENITKAKDGLAKLNISPDSIKAKGENELFHEKKSALRCYDSAVKKAGFLVASAIEVEANGDDKNLHADVLNDMDELEKNLIPIQEEINQAQKELSEKDEELFKSIRVLFDSIFNGLKHKK